MSEQRVLVLRKGFIGMCAFAALVLLVTFYSTVSGAVERAARQRLATAEAGPSATSRAMPRQQARGTALLARVGD
jgi:hypothetical protein